MKRFVVTKYLKTPSGKCVLLAPGDFVIQYGNCRDEAYIYVKELRVGHQRISPIKCPKNILIEPGKLLEMAYGKFV